MHSTHCWVVPGAPPGKGTQYRTTREGKPT